ncbi:MAG: arginine--tRNA ligase [Bdellovibrionaceae bacterium]|nr:arginine--tRNA ligase [Pseudobdellovibrionaceae bacterium]MBX3034860.1 arginine--tRNA ligase [Pseudobdellovibrionaceae bacterium]
MIQRAKTEIAQRLTSLTGRPESEIYGFLEVPKVYEHGHLAYPVFALAKDKRRPPAELANELANELQGKIPGVKSIQAAGGFLNFTLTAEALQNWLWQSLKDPTVPLGHNQKLSGQTVVVDFSSPNVAKPMHVGHFRATIIGQAIRNLAEAQGARVIGVNHIGDWGTQFGKLAWAYQQWHREYDFTKDPIESLLQLYVRFHDEAEKNPELEKFGAETFLKLEKGDPDIRRIWKEMVDVSFVEYNKLYAILGTKHDVVLGESFYNDRQEDVIQRLQAKGLLRESEGAQVVFFDEKEKMPPCLIKKSDGASIYATRDLAAAIYRHDVQKADQILYVVGVDQSLHFRQVFRVLELLGYDWAKNCHHIVFGQYRFKDGKMSTRKGKVVLFEDLIYQAIEMVTKMIDEKNPGLANKDLIARQIAAGAVIFNDLINDRVKNVDFDWDRAVNTEGDSGPYVQYTNVRCKSILRKYGREVPGVLPRVLDTDEEQRLVFSLLQFGHVVDVAYRQFKPNVLAQYLLELCGHFSHFYHKNRILGEPGAVEASRIALVDATSRVLTAGLGLLNIPSPEAM